MPKSFSFILTDIDGNRTFTSVLHFDEAAAPFLKALVPKGKSPINLDKLQCPKAIAIVSHHSFQDAFKQILTQLYRIHLSSDMPTPLERFLVNIMDEIPLPDQGNLLVQHEIGTYIIPFYRPVD